jgi:phosphoribosylformimino-5-aminoimidazole carboxamide ribotide isomerase
MIAIPALDIRDGACVQREGGPRALDDDGPRRRVGSDPIAVAREWLESGFPALHVVDLDAALGRGSNHRIIERILALRPGTVQAGGGVRSGGSITRLLNAGAARVVVGTRAIEQHDWLTAMAHSFPATLVVAADVRERHVVTRGWTRSVERDIRDILHRLNTLPLAGVLVTAVHREGQGGIDIDLVRDVMAHCVLPVYVAGGVATLGDLRTLEAAGAHAAILGRPLYAGSLDPRAVAARYAPAFRPPGGAA